MASFTHVAQDVSPQYGRVTKTKPEWDIRLYTDVPRGTEAYKKIYNQPAG